MTDGPLLAVSLFMTTGLLANLMTVNGKHTRLERAFATAAVRAEEAERAAEELTEELGTGHRLVYAARERSAAAERRAQQLWSLLGQQL